MENSYGIGTTNRFSLLIENESDPSETAIIVPDKDSKKSKSKVAEKENKGKPEAPAKNKQPTQPARKPAKETPPKPTEGKREDGKPTGPRAENKTDRPFTKFNSENREERNNRRNREERPFNGNSFDNNKDREDRPRRDNAGGDFESRRGRGGIGNRGARGAGPRRQFDDRRGKREFDRQSGSDKTGVKPVDKRDGAGAHNWGSHKDVIEEADPSKTTNDVEAVWNEGEKTDAANTTVESKEGETEAEPTPVEEEPKELTLDEWKAQRAGRQKPQYNLRKAGEGEDQTQWKKMYELSKKKAGEEEDSEDDEYDNAEYPQRVGRQKHVIGIDFHFNDSNRRGTGGRGRGTRGAGRGGRPREPRGTGGDKGGRYRNEDAPSREMGGGREESVYHARNAPKVDDERAFPSLG
ncbi:SERPINE1 mRNA-binding protein 1-like isoform X2 [Atheta coriaria]|uniref:SERPINE1 mRNA-binding protein 1-like isoform X2 n=1 Tax=Dalotia coriaria TaxID=877792 RepID=UPI0031F40125